MSWSRASDSPVVARLMGGLGNQIFIYAAALEQARRLGVDLEVDTSFYRIHTKREYGLKELFNPSLHESRSGWSVQKYGFARPALKRLGLVMEFKEESHRFHPEIFQIRAGTALEGYFQSTRYFPSVGPEIAKTIREVVVSESEQAIIEDVSSRPFVAVHVRRGDYSSEAHIRDAHGLTTSEYYEASLEILSRKGIPCIVFTDSSEEVEKELGGLSGLVFDSRISPLGELATLKLMSLASGVVMSNSSFSWWAAYTMSYFDPGSTVISPRPWSKDISFNEELIDLRWWNVGL